MTRRQDGPEKAPQTAVAGRTGVGGGRVQGAPFGHHSWPFPGVGATHVTAVHSRGRGPPDGRMVRLLPARAVTHLRYASLIAFIGTRTPTGRRPVTGAPKNSKRSAQIVWQNYDDFNSHV